LYNDELDQYAMSVEHVENPTIPNRVSMDKTVNALGRKLLQMCYNTGVTVANGRFGNDMEGRFTFCTTRGSCSKSPVQNISVSGQKIH
jgi:hypothetical protein